MSLYHKYRPTTLSELKGNAGIIDIVNKFLEKPETMPKAFLFHGETGCGKTTLARIIKNSLEIQDSDYYEYNSSDERGVDAIRTIIKNTSFKPLQSVYKMYVLDEAHKLTNDAQNALLKILEDTPKHVIFVLATTEPEKIIKAIKGRCQQFQLGLLTEKEMTRLLIRVSKKEGVSLEQEVLEQIVNDAQGHPRNALQILEQVLNVDEEKRLEVAKQTVLEQAQSIELCRVLFQNSNWKQVMPILNGLVGQDAERIRRHVLGYCQAVLLKSDNTKAGLIMEEFIDPFYNTGFPGLVYACYAVIHNS